MGHEEGRSNGRSRVFAFLFSSSARNFAFAVCGPRSHRPEATAAAVVGAPAGPAKQVWPDAVGHSPPPYNPPETPNNPPVVQNPRYYDTGIPRGR